MLALVVGYLPVPTATASQEFAAISDTGKFPTFPLRIGAYQRGKIHTYTSDDHSVGYERYDSTLQNVVTLYFYPVAQSIEAQYSSEKREILSVHSGSALLSERQSSIEKNGVTYQAFIATFQFDGVFAGQQQVISSQLVLVALPDHFFKVRSSSPVSQAAVAEASMLQLLKEVSWAY